MAHVVIINGTNSESSRIQGVQQYIEQHVEEARSIEVYKLPAQALVTADYTNEVIQAANRLIEQAQVIIILTPVYKASYTGILKTFLDLIPQKGLENKVILPIMVGGSAHHLLVIEYALKPVLSVLGATTILQGVYLIDQSIERTAHGFTIQEEARERLQSQLQKLRKEPIFLS
ncbi:NADPH-dependent FMN reductase [Lysinibacillus sp. KU-BSD001]|uniref:NADPH-dependent FMN reductase n=1 Tax=Lysinibacillus sp. KU-BSD001 TaxID=3141328 RepID=UPI0036ED3259